ncbi:CHAT domain-containing protein [Spongiimicrobium salis]|uniref:CHAT domain-containing protein n=1 Tax=Spongiimicrobium salis TaxID=1667022 RepID=UPI00374D6676
MQLRISLALILFTFLQLKAQRSVQDSIYSISEKTFYEIMKEGDFQRFDSLIPHFERTASYFKENDPKKYMGSLLYQSRMMSLRKNMKAAWEKLLLAEKTYGSSGLNIPQYEQAMAYLRSYVSFQITRKYEYEDMLTTLEQIKNNPPIDQDILALMEEHVGRTSIDYNKYDAALSHFKNARKIYQKKGYVVLESVSVNLIGVAFDGLEQLDSVLHYTKKAIEMNEVLEKPRYSTISASAYNLGLLYLERLGNFHEAETYYKKAVKYDIKAAGETNGYLCEDYRALAETYLTKNDLTKAILYAEKAVNHGKKFLGEYDSRTAQAMLILAEVYNAMDQTEIASTTIEKALLIFKKVIKDRKIPGGERHRWMVMGYYDLAEVRRNEGNMEAALALYNKGAQISKAIKRDLFLIEAYQKMALIHEENKNFTAALHYVDSLEQFLNTKFKAATYRNFDQKMSRLRLQLQTGDTTKIKARIAQLRKELPSKKDDPNIWLRVLGIELRYFNMAERIGPKEKLRTVLNTIIHIRNTFSNQQDRVFYNKNLQRLVEDAIALSFASYEKTEDDFYKQMCFKFMELNKNSALLEGLQNIRFKEIAGVPETIVSLEQHVLEELQNTNKNIIYLQNKGEVSPITLQKLKDKLLGLNEKNDSIHSVILQNYPKYAGLKSLMANENYSRFVQSTLRKNQAILEFYIGTRSWYRAILTKEDMRIERFDTSGELRELSETLRTQIQAQQKWEDTAASLQKIVFPVLPKKITSIALVTDDVLNFVPFEILQKDGAPLLKTYAIGYIGSVQLLQEQTQLVHTPGNTWSGYAPSYTANMLPNNQKEVEDIRTITNGKVYLREAATKAAFLHSSSKSNLLHLALHTELDKVNPLNNHMLFAKDSIATTGNALSAAEIYGLDLNAHMVVLSSCNTGYGKIAQGEGVMNMSRAFTYAGVSSTVMSLWKVPDKETSQIMESFYKHLKNGDSKDVALKNAKLEYLEQAEDPLLKHPYYWAGFIVSGDTTPIVQSTLWLWYVLAGVGMVFLFLVFRKRLVQHLQ